ncbi:MAG: cytochrome c biogenesis protein CcsA [Alphaproteobacteria bacterium]
MQTYWPKYLTLLRFIVGIAATALIALGVKNWISIDYSNANPAMHPEFLPMHVPVAASALMTYVAMGICGLLTLFKLRITAAIGRSLAIPGVVLALVTLITGSIWGRVTWQVWWTWDARLTTMLILFFLYLGYIAATKSFDNPVRRDQSVALLGIIGACLVPIIYYSTRWWNTLHQQPGTVMPDNIKAAFLPMLFGIMLWTIWMMLLNLQAELKADKNLLKINDIFEGDS